MPNLNVSQNDEVAVLPSNLAVTSRRTLRDVLSGRWFQLVHGRNLIYNTCWEDPQLDRVALGLNSQDRVLVITSAGCNALDYALQGPERIFAVDMNPLQNALLELKIAAIKQLDYETFFQMFGRGRLRKVREIYHTRLRPLLSAASQASWDKRIGLFEGATSRQSFYFRGGAGMFARLINVYIDRVAKGRDGIEALLAARDMDEQRDIYRQVKACIWGRLIRWLIRRDSVLSMIGVPRPQRTQIDTEFPGGLEQFVEKSVDAVFEDIPLHNNYFWRVYLTGEYTHRCCPSYLERGNFERLREGLVDKISVRTSSVADFLAQHDGTITKFVLLDHMDWLSTYRWTQLEREWQEIVDRAAPEARLLWRSAGLKTDFVNQIPVHFAGKTRNVGEILKYDHDLAARLHAQDRVHTYGSFWIANLVSQ